MRTMAVWQIIFTKIIQIQLNKSYPIELSPSSISNLLIIIIMNTNNQQPATLSSPLKIFVDKLKYFHAFNGVFFFWALLALIYYIVNTVNITCSGLQHYFGVWTGSYALEVIVPVACGLAVKQGRYYGVSYFLVSLAILYKVIVVASLLIGAWKHVGLCFIPYTFKLIIVLTNCVEIVCLLVLFVLVWRIKAVNRQILVEKLIMTKTFAES